MLTISAVILHGPEMDGPSDLGLFLRVESSGPERPTLSPLTSSLIPKLVGIDCHQYLRIRLKKLIVLRQNGLAQLQRGFDLVWYIL